MARKGGSRGGSKSGQKPKPTGGPSKSSARVKKMETYEDTLNEGGVDDFMFKRDQIMFNPQDESDEEDINANEGEEVLGLGPKAQSKKARRAEYEQEQEADEEDYQEEMPLPKQRKEKVKADRSKDGRFGKAIESSDEDEDEDASDSEDDEEGWGRSYYSRPSNRRAKEDDDAFDEKREEEREMEEREVKRLQRKAREALGGAEDWGLDESLDVEALKDDEDEAAPAPVAVPETSDPAVLLRHLEAHEPVKLALARDFPLIVHKLQKTAKGIAEMSKEAEGEESLHKGLGWLHYQTLLTYATTLAFYLHLAALPVSERPNLTEHPVLPRLLQLKEGVTMLESLDFAAGSVSDIDPFADEEDEEEDGEGDDEEKAGLVRAKRELIAKMLQASGSGKEVMDEDDDEDASELDIDEMEDAQNLWHTAGLEDGELDDLLADADEDEQEPSFKSSRKSAASSKKSKKSKVETESKPKKNRRKKQESSDSTSTASGKKSANRAAFAPLEEPEFQSTKSKKSKSLYDESDILGDPTALDEADAVDKERRKRSLQFHTSKIASTSARRAAARASRMGGDEDLPRRDRAAARDAALRKNSQAVEGEDLDGSEYTEKDKKRAREVRDEDAAEAEDGDGYYDLVKRRRKEDKDAKAAAHEEYQASKFASFEDESHEGGPRALTRAIEKNRGLTPRRSKSGRNPRVKKRQAYEKAKQKVGSQRAVFKGGQATLGGSYSGEKTGISTAVKSRKF